MKKIIKQFQLPFKSVSPKMKKKMAVEQSSTSNYKIGLSASNMVSKKKYPADNLIKNKGNQPIGHIKKPHTITLQKINTEYGPLIKKVNCWDNLEKSRKSWKIKEKYCKYCAEITKKNDWIRNRNRINHWGKTT